MKTNIPYDALDDCRFPLIPLGMVVRYTTGWTPTSNDPVLYGGDHKWATISDLGNRFISNTQKTISDKAVEVQGSPEKSLPGDLLFSFKLSVGLVSIVKEPMFTNEAVASFKQSEKLDMRFAYYALPVYLPANARPNIYGAPLLNADLMSRAKVPLIDLETQRRIADYLDKEISEMEAMIEDLETLAENLKSRKVLLTERITSQDDQGNKYPTYPIGLLFRNIGSGTTPKGNEWYTESDEQGVPWVTTSELREINITDTKRYITKKAIEKVPGLRIHPAGSIMIAMYGATIGRFGRLEVPASCNQACCVLSDPYKIDPDFFYASLWAKRDELILLGSGGGQPNVSQDVIKRFKMPVPPFEDQKKIAERLQVENAHMDGLIHDATTLSELLKERKTALITEVVTGRKEV